MEKQNYVFHTTSRAVDTLDLSEKTFLSREEVHSSITLVPSFRYPRETRGWICLLEAYASILLPAIRQWRFSSSKVLSSSEILQLSNR